MILDFSLGITQFIWPWNRVSAFDNNKKGRELSTPGGQGQPPITQPPHLKHHFPALVFETRLLPPGHRHHHQQIDHAIRKRENLIGLLCPGSNVCAYPTQKIWNGIERLWDKLVVESWIWIKSIKHTGNKFTQVVVVEYTDQKPKTYHYAAL